MKIMFLSRNDIEKVLDMKSTIEGVREVYRLKSLGMTAVWPLISYDFENPRGVMDIKSGCVFGENVHGLKMLNSFPGNAQRGLPVFTGMLMIFDSETGIPQGVMDASYITCMRTGAAGALGASLLARPESHRLFILGAGRQAMFQIAASLMLMPKIDAVRISDPLDAGNARSFAAQCRARLLESFGIDASGVSFEAAEDIEAALAGNQKRMGEARPAPQLRRRGHARQRGDRAGNIPRRPHLRRRHASVPQMRRARTRRCEGRRFRKRRDGRNRRRNSRKNQRPHLARRNNDIRRDRHRDAGPCDR